MKVSLRIRQTGEEDRVLQRRFERGQTLGFGYRLRYAIELDRERPDLQEARCDVFLGRIEENGTSSVSPTRRTVHPANWPQGTKWPIRFRTSGSPPRTFCGIHPKHPPTLGEEHLLFRLGEHKGSSLELWFLIEVLAGK